MSRLAPDWLTMRAARVPDEPAIKTASLSWTRAQLLEASDSLSAALADAGVEPGSRVASLLSDDAPAVVLINAVRRLGAVLVPLNRRSAASELREQLEAVSARLLVFDRAHAEQASVAASDVEGLGVEALLAAAPCAVRPQLRDEIDLDAPGVIVFTSGTSGTPKGAVLSHGNLAASAHAWAELLRPLRSDRWLACLPLFHVAGLAVVTRSARWGVALEIMQGFEAGAVSRALDGGVSHVSLVPTQLDELLKARRGLPPPAGLRAVLLGGGPIPAVLLERARAAGYPVITTYGMTETSSGIAAGGLDAATLADPTAGRPLHRVEVRIAEPDPADGSGEILVRGPMVFSGYLGSTAATAEPVRDGWLHTGDIGTLDAAGLLRVADRRSDLLVSGGENVYPAQIEEILCLHPAIAQAAVVGQPDARWGAVPIAFVVLQRDAVFSASELQQHCRAHLAAYKVPVEVHRLGELPRDELGKVRRQDLLTTIPGAQA